METRAEPYVVRRFQVYGSGLISIYHGTGRWPAKMKLRVSARTPLSVIWVRQVIHALMSDQVPGRRPRILP